MKIPLRFTCIVIQIWKWYQDGKSRHTYVLCSMLGCSNNIFQINKGNGDSHDVDIKLEGNGALYIHEDAHVITYLQASEVSNGWTPKECD
jgi:hypothetical protein